MNLWWVHLGASLVADVLLVFCAATCAVYLQKDHQLKSSPSMTIGQRVSLLTLDRASSWLMLLSFLLMSLGMFSGGVMAKKWWGKAWFLDPRWAWSVGCWFVFATVVFGRMSVGWRGRKAAWVSLIGVGLVLIGVVVLNVGELSRHTQDFIPPVAAP